MPPSQRNPFEQDQDLSPFCQDHRRTFRTRSDQHADRNGQPCTILYTLTYAERGPEAGLMFRVRFDDGYEIDVRSEEVRDG